MSEVAGRPRQSGGGGTIRLATTPPILAITTKPVTNRRTCAGAYVRPDELFRIIVGANRASVSAPRPAQTQTSSTAHPSSASRLVARLAGVDGGSAARHSGRLSPVNQTTACTARQKPAVAA